MKKIVSSSTFILLAFVAFSQNTPQNSNTNTKNSLDTISKTNNLSKDTATKNWNNAKQIDSANSTIIVTDSMKNNSNTTTLGTNSVMKTDSSAMSAISKNTDSIILASQNVAATSSNTLGKTSEITSTSDSIKAYEKTLTDRVMMKDDKMYLLMEGNATEMEKDYKLSSGALVSTTGSVKYPGGKIVTLKNGQFIEIKPTVSETVYKKVAKSKKSTKTLVTKKKTKTHSK